MSERINMLEDNEFDSNSEKSEKNLGNMAKFYNLKDNDKKKNSNTKKNDKINSNQKNFNFKPDKTDFMTKDKLNFQKFKEININHNKITELKPIEEKNIFDIKENDKIIESENDTNKSLIDRSKSNIKNKSHIDKVEYEIDSENLEDWNVLRDSKKQILKSNNISSYEGTERDLLDDDKEHDVF